MGFYLKEDAGNTPRPSMAGISTLTTNQKQLRDDPIKAKSKEFCSPDKRQKQQKVPSFSTSTIVAAEFQHWLESTAGGGKAKSQAAQVCSRAMKFLRFCFEDNSDEDDVAMQMVDYCLGSANLTCQFLDAMENGWKLGHSGRLSYLNALHDLMDFRKFSRPPGNVLCDFAITDIYMVESITDLPVKESYLTFHKETFSMFFIV